MLGALAFSVGAVLAVSLAALRRLPRPPVRCGFGAEPETEEHPFSLVQTEFATCMLQKCTQYIKYGK